MFIGVNLNEKLKTADSIFHCNFEMKMDMFYFCKMFDNIWRSYFSN